MLVVSLTLSQQTSHSPQASEPALYMDLRKLACNPGLNPGLATTQRHMRQWYKGQGMVCLWYCHLCGLEARKMMCTLDQSLLTEGSYMP